MLTPPYRKAETAYNGGCRGTLVAVVLNDHGCLGR